MINLYKISSPSFNQTEFNRFLTAEGCNWLQTEGASEAEDIVEASGRLCYMSFGTKQSPKDNNSYIRHLISQGHESVLEHVNWTFVLTGISRAFTHQLVRHRVGFSYSQLSQQYHDESDATFVLPKHISEDEEASAIWKRAISATHNTYRELLALLDKKESDSTALPEREKLRLLRSEARSVLPNATETKIAITVNARALRHFLEVRGAIEGDIECREVSAALLEAVRPDAPSIFEDFEVHNWSDNLPIVLKQPLISKKTVGLPGIPYQTIK